MNSNLVKLGIGLSGATTIGVGATAIYLTTSKDEKKQDSTNENHPQKVTSKKSINEFLKDKNLILIGDQDNEKWTEKWKAFQKEYASVNPPAGWIMENWESKKGADAPTPSEFQKLCKDNGNKEIDAITDKNFELTEKHCTKTIGT